MVLTIKFKDFQAIHFANGYDLCPNASQLFKRIAAEIKEAPFADVNKAPSFENYCDAVLELD